MLKPNNDHLFTEDEDIDVGKPKQDHHFTEVEDTEVGKPQT